MKKTAIVGLVLIAIAVGWEFYAVAQDGIWTWSELLNEIAGNQFALVLVSWFIGFVMGHALAPAKR